LTPSTTQSNQVPKDQTDQISDESFEDLLVAISVILEATPDDDVIRPLILLNWSRFKPTGVYRAPWLELLGKHPKYAADLLEAQGNRETKLVGDVDMLTARHRRDMSAREATHKSEISNQKTASDALVAKHKRQLDATTARMN